MNVELDRNQIEEKYKNYINKKVERYVAQKWWGPIKGNEIRRWIKQFPEDSLVPYLLLDSLNIITTEQIEASLRAILEQLRSNIFCENPNLSDEELYALWNNHMEKTLFIPAHTVRDSISSAPIITRTLKKLIPNFESHTSVAEELCGDLMKATIENVYFVDDFIGTGRQMSGYLEHEFYCNSNCCTQTEKKSCSIRNLMSVRDNVKFNVITVAQHNAGGNKLKRAHPQLNFLTANTLDDTYDLLSSTCSVYIDEKYLCDVQKAIAEIKKTYNVSNDYSLNLPLGFEHGFPNNALETYWWSQSNWQPLIGRSD